MDLKNISELLKGISIPNINLPDLHNTNYELNLDALELGSLQEDSFEELKKITKELKENNNELRKANSQLIKTLEEQHLHNTKLQKSNSRISLANLILVVITLFSAIFSTIINYNNDKRSSDRVEQVIMHTITVNELQTEILNIREELNRINNEKEELLIENNKLMKENKNVP